MPQQITCPSCRAPLVLRDDAPPIITCPRCLAAVFTPGAARRADERGAAVDPHADIPFAREVEADLMGANRAVVLVGTLMIGSGILWFFSKWSPLALLLIVCGTILIGVWTSLWRARNLRIQNLPEGTPDQDAQLRPGDVLAYAVPQRPGSAGGPGAGATVGRFVGGFFLGIGACAICFFIFGGTAQQPAGSKLFFLGLVTVGLLGLGILGAQLERANHAIGLGRGIAVGLVLGLMALGPCAFCYIAI